MSLRAIVIDGKDNVANLVGAGKKGQEVICDIADKEKISVELREDIPSNHKFALMDIRKGQTITKYGLTVGQASQDIRKGQYVHVQNVESNRGRGDLA